MKNKEKNSKSNRIGTVGGQAVLEGVMMKSKNRSALSVRDINGKINTEIINLSPLSDKYPALKIPLIRGVINFVEMMIFSFKTLNKSAEMLGIEEEESKFEKWLEEKFGKSISTLASIVGTVLGVALSIFLFFYLPALLSDFVLGLEGSRLLKSTFEGITKMIVFILYVYLVSLIPDIKRVFQYHGAEHKSVFCHEAGEELTVENVKKHSRYHPRCGTSFLVVMMIIGILVSTLFINFIRPIRILLKFLTLPIIVGLGYEFIKYAGTHNNLLVKIISAPGLWIQRLTTREPDGDQIEVAIRALKAAVPDFYPEIIEELELENDKSVDSAETQNGEDAKSASESEEASDDDKQ